MKISRFHAVAVAVVATSLVSTSAFAATKPKPKPVKPVCNLMTDAKGDGEGLLNSADGLDIVTGDIASDAKNFTAVLRLAGPPSTSPTPDAPEGSNYYVLFSVPSATNVMYLSMSIDFKGAVTYNYGDLEKLGTSTNYTDRGDATGSIKGSTVTISVPLATLAGLGSIKPGTKVTGLQGEVYVPIGVPMVVSSLQPADVSDSGKSYVAGAKSCVTPGAI
jgi:hypothetical protein